MFFSIIFITVRFKNILYLESIEQYRRALAIESTGILTGITDERKTRINESYKLVVWKTFENVMVKVMLNI